MKRGGLAGWLLVVTLALVVALTASPGGIDSGRGRAGRSADSTTARVTQIVDDFIRNDHTGSFNDVRAILMFRGARPLLERYYKSSAGVTSNVASVTKSVTSILVGIALDEGELHSVDQTLMELLPVTPKP